MQCVRVTEDDRRALHTVMVIFPSLKVIVHSEIRKCSFNCRSLAGFLLA